MHGSYVRVEGDNTLAVPIDLFRRYQQVIFRKRTIDFFLNPKADRFVTNLPAAEYIMVGVSIEGSIKSIALGLVARNKPVTVVLDACGYFDRSEADMATRLLEAKGVRMMTMDELVARSLPRPFRYPRTAERKAEEALRNGLYATTTDPSRRNGNGHVSTENHGGHGRRRASAVRLVRGTVARHAIPGEAHPEPFRGILRPLGQWVIFAVRARTRFRFMAAYPSGLRGRIANPLFVGSNPTAAFFTSDLLSPRNCHAHSTFPSSDCLDLRGLLRPLLSRVASSA